MPQSSHCPENAPLEKVPAFLPGPELDWKPEYLVASSWLQHIPFAFWIIQAVRPDCLVELGTHYGASYFAFCQAVERLGLSTRCFAVDSWEGDVQAGQYGQEVFDTVERYNRRKYAAFSSLLRARFDAARPYFHDGEIDLLHIDGFHTYEAVSNDFALWRSSLSKRGIVLFHDINVRERNFGVWRFWREITEKYPYFEFFHGCGLGVAAVGPEIPPALGFLFALEPNGDMATSLRTLFAARGEAVLNAYRIIEYIEQVNDLFRKNAECKEEIEQQKLQHRLAVEQNEANHLSELQKNNEIYLSDLKKINDIAKQKEDNFQFEIKIRDEEIQKNNEKYMHELQETTKNLNFKLQQEHDQAQFVQQQIYASWSWRITAPLRLGRSILSDLIRKSPFRLRERLGAWRSRLENVRQDTQRPVPLPSERPCHVVWVGGEPDTPGYHYRVVMPALAGKAAGADVCFFRLDEIDSHHEAIAAADVVILWRAAWDANVDTLFRLARVAGAKICFDLDDLMFDCRLATVDVIDGIRSQSLEERQVSEFYARVLKTMEAADLCLATTPELAGHMRAFGKPVSILPNGFDEAKFQLSRQAHRRRKAAKDDGLLRLGYAGGSRTHQRDFSLCVDAVVRVLRRFENARLVLFRCAHGTPLVDLDEYPDLAALEDRIEWRQMVPVTELPNELARFDVNLAPVEVGNFFCEAKSELKFFEAALAGVCTIASPTGPFRRAIRHGETGLLATDETQWYEGMVRLLSDREERARMAKRALDDVLWTFGPERRVDLVASFLEQVRGGRAAARAFALDVRLEQASRPAPDVPEADVVFEHDRLAAAAATVIIPLYNYAAYIAEALDSVAAQTEPELDLIVVDDASTDHSLDLAVDWAKAHTDRFNRLLVLKNRRNSKLGPTRNVGFDAADTLYVLPLDADNILLPSCVSTCLDTMRRTGAAFVYPKIETFGSKRYRMGEAEYAPHRFIGGNYIDAMALIAKSVWCAVGGYENVPHGWEDYEFWCRIVEMGLPGQPAGPSVLAKYRVHGDSMLTNSTNVPKNFTVLTRYIQERHPWLHIASDAVGQALENKPS